MSKAPRKPKTPAGDRDVANLPLQLREAQIVPASFNEADNTVDLVWTTGARRRAYDWYNDTIYEEELVVTPDAVDMSRFEAGTVQVLDNHSIFGGTGSILGVATRGSIKDGEGLATIKLSTDPAKAGVVGDIRAGVIRAISFGYTVQKYEITRAQDRPDGVNLPLYRAVQWQPREISFVTVPADPNASTREDADAALTRSEPKHGFPCEFMSRAAAQTHEAPTMTDAELQAKREADEKAAREKVAADAAQAERQRAADITALCTRASVPKEKLQAYIADGASVEKVRNDLLETLVERDANAGQRGQNVTRVITISDEAQTRMDGMQEAIAHRVRAIGDKEITDNGRQYRGMSLLEIGREHLERSGVNTRGMDRMTLATNIMQFRSGGGFMGTSDFASLLANVANKRLRQAYEENMPSYQRWARRAPDAPDFKTMTVVNLGSTPDLLQVNEHGEFKYASMTDGKETYGLLTYGRVVAVSRQALVNDDLRGFDRLVQGFGNSAARLENRTVYGILTANAALSDTVALFHATHANLAGSGAAINVTTLTAGRAAMRLQKGLQSEELNIAPRYLIVPATQEQVAYQYTSANYVPAVQSNVNEFRAGGRTALEPIVEAVLDANSTTAWYLAADNAQIDTVEYCWLEGAAGPVVESEIGFDVDGIKLKGRLDFAAKAIDYRGLYKNPGA